MLNININGVLYKANRGLTVLQFCLSNGVNIPSFCYHERLNIAGNCRMCLVEIKGLPKPIESCTMLLQDNMSIFTDTPFVKKAQENILESVLFMHPLDCPICDQGGECDLQDQAFQYGADRGRFFTARRLVFDKNCGFFVKTVMTRCIHCTRCVRFSAEICDTPYFGTLKRGGSTEIAYYKVKPFRSELSANVIDLCPVGALTSKPHSFIGRPWEDSFEAESFDILDPLGSSITVLSTNTKLIKIIPRVQNNVNKEWISDKIRFCYDSLENNRLLVSYKRTTRGFFQKNLSLLNKNFSNKFFKLSFFYFSNTSVDFSFFYQLYNMSLTSNYFKNFSFYRNLFFYKSSTHNLDFRSNFIDFFFLDNLNNYDSFIFMNTNLKQEYPIFNSYLNMYSKKNSSSIFSFGNPIYSNLFFYHIGSNLKSLFSFFKGNHLLSKNLYESTSILFLGQQILSGSVYFKDNDLYKNIYQYLDLQYNSFFFNKKSFNINFFNLFTSLQDSSLIEVGYFYNNTRLLKNNNNFNLNFFFFPYFTNFFFNYKILNKVFFFKKFINFFDTYNNVKLISLFSNNSRFLYSTHGFSFKNQKNNLKYILPLSSFFERSNSNLFLYYGYLGKKQIKHFLSSNHIFSELFYLNLYFNRVFLKKKDTNINELKKSNLKSKNIDFKLNFNFNIKDLRFDILFQKNPCFYGITNKKNFYNDENLIVHSKNLAKAKDLFLKVPFNI